MTLILGPSLKIKFSPHLGCSRNIGLMAFRTVASEPGRNRSCVSMTVAINLMRGSQSATAYEKSSALRPFDINFKDVNATEASVAQQGRQPVAGSGLSGPSQIVRHLNAPSTERNATRVLGMKICDAILTLNRSMIFLYAVT